MVGADDGGEHEDAEVEADLCALNVAYLRERLDDPTLLSRTVDVGDAAVPVGGKRRGGFVCVCDSEQAAQIIAVLSEHRGFPDLRFESSDDREAMSIVRWGGAPPPCPEIDAPDLDWACLDLLADRYYGYSETTVRSFMTRQHGKRLVKAAFRRHPL